MRTDSTIRNHEPCRTKFGARRGSVGVAVILILVLVQVAVVSVVLSGARDQDTTVRRLESVRAFYAAEAGMNMAIREVRENNDEDGDGGIGSISDDGNDANNPSLGQASVWVTSAVVNDDTEFYSVASAGTATREVTSVMPPAAVPGAFGYFTPFSSGQLGVAGKQIASQVELLEDGYVTSITARINGPSPKLTRFGIYTDSAGEPGNLIAQSYNDTIDGNAASYHWRTLYIPSTFLTAGTYWLAICVEHANIEYSYSGTGGQTRSNDNDAIASGFSATWGASTDSNTRRANIYATRMIQKAGPATFASSADYDNANPPTTGLFRDLTNATWIERGSDVSSNTTKYNSINFTQASGLVNDCMTAFDATPSDATPTTFEGTIRVSADVLLVGASGERWVGLGALHSETSGQEGIGLVLKEDTNKDHLSIIRIPQSGNIMGQGLLADTGNYNEVTAANWYRLYLDITILGSNITIEGRMHTHSTANNPNSAVNAAPSMDISHSGTLSSFAGLQDFGEVVLFFDTADNTSRASLTNVTIEYDSGPVAGGYLASWAETEHRD
jgi:hypothetical protein